MICNESRIRLLAVLFALGPCFHAWAQQVAFPGAEGYGKTTVGGRGGRVLIVSNLNSSGPGSLGEAIATAGPRTIVFRVSGTIEGDFSVRHDHVTIAGHSAPGDGICIKGSLAINANEVIVRYLRVRADPSKGEVDAISGRDHRNIILDHVSASWSSDEVMSLYRNENVTIQWCIISEACAKILDGKNTGHRFGGIWGNHHGSYHHNLIAHNDSRNPRWSSGAGSNDFRNNVLFNWGYNSCYGGGALDSRNPHLDRTRVNMVANYYKPGPATESKVRRRIASPSADNEGRFGAWFVAENIMEGSSEVTDDNWLGIDGTDYERLETPWEGMEIPQESAREAYEQVLLHAGCSYSRRDAVDLRLVEEVRSGSTSYGQDGIITTPADVGGWPALEGGTAAEDVDKDGMADAWEVANGLNPRDFDDAVADRDQDGFTNLEEFLNERIR